MLRRPMMINSGKVIIEDKFPCVLCQNSVSRIISSYAIVEYFGCIKDVVCLFLSCDVRISE